jgi:hypothetical protein
MLKYKIKSKLSLSYTYSNKNNKSIPKNPEFDWRNIYWPDQAELWITSTPSMRTGGLTKKALHLAEIIAYQLPLDSCFKNHTRE